MFAGSQVAINWASDPPHVIDPQTGGYLAWGKLSDDDLAAEFRRSSEAWASTSGS